MALIQPNDIVGFIDGAHFYGTAHDFSDYDIMLVHLQPIDEFLRGVTYRPKQKHGVSWLGNNCDVTRYEMSHVLNLMAKGNVQIIEKFLMTMHDNYLYRSHVWVELERLLQLHTFVDKALQHTNWGHIRGWMHKTLKKVDSQGLSVKRAVLLMRMVVEARTYIEKEQFVCQWPDLIYYAKTSDERILLETLYKLRLAGEDEFKLQSTRVQLEKHIFVEIDHVTSLMDSYEPRFIGDIHRHKQQLLKDIREYQLKHRNEYNFH